MQVFSVKSCLTKKLICLKEDGVWLVLKGKEYACFWVYIFEKYGVNGIPNPQTEWYTLPHRVVAMW